jgi:Right handed beta helix region
VFRLSATLSALSLIAAVAATSAEAAQRAFVASTGSDANTTSGCGLATPCRTFTAALTVVDDGGEVIALDAAGYGPVTITKSVAITANPGFYAGIAVVGTTDNAVTIATAGVNVTLRSLNINGIGALDGVSMTNGNRLSIENCVISNFSEYGVVVSTAATVRIVDSTIRDNSEGINLQGGTTVTISGTKLLGNFNGVEVGGTSSITTAVISDTIVMGRYVGSSLGIYAGGVNATAPVRVSVTRSTISNNLYGIWADTGGGDTVVTVSNSMVTGNTGGLYQTGTGSTLETLGDNTVRQNGTNTSGTITTVSPM